MTVTLSLDLAGAHTQLEERRLGHLQALDSCIAALGSLRQLDEHLVAMGLQAEPQLPPIEVEPEREEPVVDATVKQADAALDLPVVPRPAPKPAKKVARKATAKKASSGKQACGKRARRQFTQEQRLELVDRTAHLSVNAAANEADVSRSVMHNWRLAAWGTAKSPVTPKVASQTDGVSTIKPEGRTKVADLSFPSVKCPSCHAMLPIEGSTDSIGEMTTAKGQAFEKHYKTDPACEATNRRRGR